MKIERTSTDFASVIDDFVFVLVFGQLEDHH